MTLVAAAAAGTDRPAATAAKIKTASHTKFLTRPGAPDRHPYELYLAVNDIEHTRTMVKHPQTNGICERFQKTVLHEFYQVVLRRTLYPGLEALQRDLDQWMKEYNESRPHQGRWCYGKTPMPTFLDSVPLAKEKQIA
jgi:transposase InsO family protein